MYCNSCMGIIRKDDLVYCEQCGSPLHSSCANHCLSCGKALCDNCYIDNDFKCEECYQKPEQQFSTIRRSHLEQYAGCPYSIYLQLIKGIEPPMGSYAQLGIIVHHIFDMITDHDISLEEALKKLEEDAYEWNGNYNNGKEEDLYSIITNELINNGVECINNFFMIKNSLGNDYVSEKNIIFSVDDTLPKISCTLDRIEHVNDSNIIIHDWKTGKPMAGQKLVTDLQPPLYIQAVKEEYGVYPTRFVLHYLRFGKHLVYTHTGNGIYEVETTRNKYVLDVNEALERARKILEGINKGHFNMPNGNTHEWRCKNMCWFGKANVCSGVGEEQWKALSSKYDEEK